MFYNLLRVYLILVNAAGFLLMHADKKKARRSAWRIPEATLLGIAAIGGSIGAMVGMVLFRHKTKHPKFFLGLPTILLAQAALVFLIIHLL